MLRIFRLADLRRAFGLKQSDVAQFLGIAQQQYSLYERGARTLPLRHLAALCDLYPVSADYLLGRTDNPKRSPPP